jgi:chemotaxis protein CheC
VWEVSELERDAVTEIANIAVGRAAASLRQLVGHEVLLEVPSVEILTREAASQVIATPGNRQLVAVCQDFEGALSGRALLIFPESNSLELVRVIVGKDFAIEDIIDLEKEALAETGNIILNCCVATMANILKQNLTMSLPSVVRGTGRDLFNDARSEESLVLFLYINFEISRKEIRGYLALLLDLPSLAALKTMINQFLTSVEHQGS